MYIKTQPVGPPRITAKRLGDTCAVVSGSLVCSGAIAGPQPAASSPMPRMPRRGRRQQQQPPKLNWFGGGQNQNFQTPMQAFEPWKPQSGTMPNGFQPFGPFANDQVPPAYGSSAPYRSRFDNSYIPMHPILAGLNRRGLNRLGRVGRLGIVNIPSYARAISTIRPVVSTVARIAPLPTPVVAQPQPIVRPITTTSPQQPTYGGGAGGYGRGGYQRGGSGGSGGGGGYQRWRQGQQYQSGQGQQGQNWWQNQNNPNNPNNPENLAQLEQLYQQNPSQLTSQQWQQLQAAGIIPSTLPQSEAGEVTPTGSTTAPDPECLAIGMTGGPYPNCIPSTAGATAATATTGTDIGTELSTDVGGLPLYAWLLIGGVGLYLLVSKRGR